MIAQCPSCSTRHEVDSKFGGRRGVCSKCGTRFVLPIPDAERLLAWVSSAPWHRVERFVQNNGARGHSRHTVDRFIEAVHQRRSREQDAERFIDARAKGLAWSWSQDERRYYAIDVARERKKMLRRLRNLHPKQLDEVVAAALVKQGLQAEVVESNEYKFDVRVQSRQGELVAVVVCKRYARQNRVFPDEVEAFIQTVLANNSPLGYLFTTSRFTKRAKRIAAVQPGVRLYNGRQLVLYLEAVERALSPIDLPVVNTYPPEIIELLTMPHMGTTSSSYP